MTDAQLKCILRFQIYTGEQSKQKQNPKAIIAGFWDFRKTNAS